MPCWDLQLTPPTGIWVSSVASPLSRMFCLLRWAVWGLHVFWGTQSLLGWEGRVYPSPWPLVVSSQTTVKDRRDGSHSGHCTYRHNDLVWLLQKHIQEFLLTGTSISRSCSHQDRLSKMAFCRTATEGSHWAWNWGISQGSQLPRTPRPFCFPQHVCH